MGFAVFPLSRAPVRQTDGLTDWLANCLPAAQAAGRQHFFLAIEGTPSQLADYRALNVSEDAWREKNHARAAASRRSDFIGGNPNRATILARDHGIAGALMHEQGFADPSRNGGELCEDWARRLFVVRVDVNHGLRTASETDCQTDGGGLWRSRRPRPNGTKYQWPRGI